MVLEYTAVPQGNRIATFRSSIVLSFFKGLDVPEDGGTVILRNVSNLLPIERLLYSRRIECSTTPP